MILLEGLQCVFFFQYCRQYCRHGCGLVFHFILFIFFIPDSSELTTTSEEIPQWYSSTYSEYSEEDYMCVPWLLGPDCCRSVVGCKTQWLCYQAHYEEAQDLMCSCVDERIISEQEKKKVESDSHEIIDWTENRTRKQHDLKVLLATLRITLLKICII